MLIHCGLLLLFLNCVRTTEYVYPNGVINDQRYERFSWWPSVHNAASLVRLKRDAVQTAEQQVPELSEGGGLGKPPPSSSVNLQDAQTAVENNEAKKGNKDNTTAAGNSTAPVTTAPLVVNATETKNATAEVKIDLNNPGVLKRGFIVFGGFSLLAVAYFIFYRRKGKNNDIANGLNSNESNQFRYGVLQSEDRRDNLELSRVPLTMESDDDEEEDLEIFDLEQKKKSLSYVNLQTNDEDVVFPQKESIDNDRENLLLDIEDGTSETLINWSSSGSKSIL